MGSLAAQQYCCEYDETLDGLILSGSTCFDLLPSPEGEAAGLEAFNAPLRTGADALRVAIAECAAGGSLHRRPRCAADASR